MPDLEKIDYPLYKYYYSLEYILDNFEKLKTYKQDEIKTNRKNILYNLNINFKRDEKFVRITDYFTEECRVKCNFGDYISPYDYFQTNRKVIVENVGKNPPYHKIDSQIYNSGIKQCTLFNLIVCTSILKYFKPKRWLDPSAGWGDRLIAAINYGDCTYRATDPNSCLHPKYKEIIDTFGADKKDYKITKEGFEVAQIEADYYDLVFTSPPFFDLEKYSDEESQSNVKYNSLEKWFDGFMYPFLIKGVAALQKNGHFCLYVNDYRTTKYVSKIKDYFKNNKKMEFVGNIGWKAGSGFRNIMVYRKIK